VNALKFGGFVATAVAGAINVVLNLQAQAVGALLKGAGYLVNEVTAALGEAFDLAGEALREVLEALDYGLEVICEIVPIWPPCLLEDL
jgi:hypothetical protein